MLMEFCDTDLKRFEDCGCESKKWWPVYHCSLYKLSCRLLNLYVTELLKCKMHGE